MNLEGYDISKFSPMMKQYIEIKKDYADAIVFFRLGDFYEMFFEDAILGSRELELQLTGKDCGQEERVPMCGIPFHAYEGYALRLVEKGYKIAIVEQTEDPALAKGIVKREVVKILTPGTCVIGEKSHEENNYLAVLKEYGKEYIFAYVDVLTGEINITNLVNDEEVLNEIFNLNIKELLVESRFNKKIIDILKTTYNILITRFDLKDIPTYLGNIVMALDQKEELDAIGLLVNYILKTQKEHIMHLKEVRRYQYRNYLKIDMHSKRNLELMETIRLNKRNGSLLSLIDKTHTAMGLRMLIKWLNYPLVDEKEIIERLDYVEAFNNERLLTDDIIEELKGVYDLERIVGKASCGTCNAKDFAQLRKTLENVSNLKKRLLESKNQNIVDLAMKIDDLFELQNVLNKAITDNPPFQLHEGGMIRPEYNSELQELYDIKNHSQEWLKKYEEKEREKSGIKNLKVGFNKVFGYYIEITKSFLNEGYLENYERKQTLVNAERFITPELKDFEVKILSSSDRIIALEYNIFLEIKDYILSFIKSLQNLANIVSEIDCFISLSTISRMYRFIRPEFTKDRSLTIIDGRHPVLQELLKNDYISNDVIVNKYNFLLITGPNMSGKSTYMKMVALIAILAQMGSFVPATTARLPIFDQIFTRIGASDDLTSGSSTFMVEMLEANYALKNATKNSLILFDEIGRGTATFDGLALAQAIIEYTHENIGCITLFSTHYHELVALEKTLSRLKNIHVDVKEYGGKVVFLHKVLDGPVDKSYGINVAELAHLPKSLIKRSKEILASLEDDRKELNMNLSLFDFNDEDDEIEERFIDEHDEEILDEIDNLDINNLTPLEAFNLIIKWKNKE